MKNLALLEVNRLHATDEIRGVLSRLKLCVEMNLRLQISRMNRGKNGKL